MSYVKIKIVKQLSKLDEISWSELFLKCFEKKITIPVFRKKYPKDRSVFCVAILNDNIIANYSGVIFDYDGVQCFLSTDTMSNGELRGATKKLASELYEYLAKEGVEYVVGFPNKNIINLRFKLLGWKMIGKKRLYLGYHFAKNTPVDKVRVFNRNDNFLIWTSNNWTSSLFTKMSKLSFFPYLCLSESKPGTFWVRVPFITEKIFCGRSLSSNMDFQEKRFLQKCFHDIGISGIDLP